MAEADEKLNGKMADSEALQKECEAVEAELAAIKVLYEQYFLGVERQPPRLQHANLAKRMTRLKSTFARQTAVKFRIQSLGNKFLSYQRLWERTLLEIENGTYHRDVFKARLRSQAKQAEKPADKKAPGAEAPPAIAPVVPPGGAARPAGQRPAAPGTLSDAKLKALFNEYVSAKRNNQEDVSKLTFESMAANLRKQVPELLKKHKASAVDFKVVIKDGKAVLRAVPR